MTDSARFSVSDVDPNEIDPPLPPGVVEFDREAGISTEQVAQLLPGMEERQQSALVVYRIARTTGTLYAGRNPVVLASWRCSPRGCLLLDVFQIVGVGLAAYTPPFRQSPELNEETAPTARAQRTSDGERRWVERADVLLPDELEYWLSCDHLSHVTLTGRQARMNANGRVAITLV